jgi:hypothetical protein
MSFLLANLVTALFVTSLLASRASRQKVFTRNCRAQNFNLQAEAQESIPIHTKADIDTVRRLKFSASVCD